MATLTGQSIASSYEQLLHVDTDGGGNTTTLVPIKDGDNGTTFCLQLATTSALIVDDAKLYFGTGSDASIEYDEDGADNLSIAGSDVSIADGIGLIVGNTAQVAMGEVTSEVQILGTTETDASLAIGLWSTTDALSPSLKFVKGAHATIGTHTTTVADNEELGKIQAYGSDTADSDTLSSEIAFNIDDDGVGAGTLGGEILLKTSGKDGTLDTAVTIDSSQYVGIGISPSTSKLHIQDSDYTTVTIQAGTTSHGAILNLGDSDDIDYGSIAQFASSAGEDGRMRFIAGTTETMNLRGGDVEVTTGDIVFKTAGKGICLGVTSNTDANTLDDYEEGTWTGVISDGTNNATMNLDSGYYTKVGNIVNIQAQISTLSLGSVSGGLRLTGLPFTSSDLYAAAQCGFAMGMAITSGTYVSGYLQTGATHMVLTNWASATGISALLSGGWSSDGNFIISSTYRTA